ncbi:GLPGLI family protein [Sediminicola luteus]|uniref:GLPGLI family protein n=1 Tax=Sediminicola luteus TaxID=319238 RepID=A0A2A4G6E4_9FLAO|nr:GLPGLI family protein [Sediminicola luteus]PCE63315.1 hypothetical protein B7P33_13940 [Sediminicola luteus]
MTLIRIVLTLVMTLMIGFLNAQQMTGRAVYKSMSKMEIRLDSTEASAAMQADLQEQLMEAMKKDYELNFNSTESNWKELPKLDKSMGGGGIQVIGIASGGGADGLLYKNTKTKGFSETQGMFGKLFLIEGDLEEYEWELGSETKQIGQYTCYKATAVRKFMASSFSSSDDGVDSSEQEREQTLTAWYSPEIAVNHGPDVFWGLPGLILEISNGERTLICSQVILNPSDAKAVVPATKGKKVTEAEYEDIMEKQMQKMHRMHGGRKKGDGRGNIEIRIGG